MASGTDYHAYGFAMAGRTWEGGDSYRFGFNGKENDKPEEWGGLYVQDYGFRMYMSEYCRFLTVDPLRGDYPELSTYQFASNSPIYAIDLDGLEAHPSILFKKHEIQTTTNYLQVKNQSLVLDGQQPDSKNRRVNGKIVQWGDLKADGINLMSKGFSVLRYKSLEQLNGVFDGGVAGNSILFVGNHGLGTSMAMGYQFVSKNTVANWFEKNVSKGALSGKDIVFFHCESASKEAMGQIAKHTGANVYASFTEVTGGYSAKLPGGNWVIDPLSTTLNGFKTDNSSYRNTIDEHFKRNNYSQEEKQAYLDNIGYNYRYSPDGKVERVNAGYADGNGNWVVPEKNIRNDESFKQKLDEEYKHHGLTNPDNKK